MCVMCEKIQELHSDIHDLHNAIEEHTRDIVGFVVIREGGVFEVSRRRGVPEDYIRRGVKAAAVSYWPDHDASMN